VGVAVNEVVSPLVPNPETVTILLQLVFHFPKFRRVFRFPFLGDQGFDEAEESFKQPPDYAL
jgi:hypothetical protein